MILSTIARYSLLLQFATTAIVMPSASGAHLRRLGVSSSPDAVHVWMTVPVKMDGCCAFDDAADSCPDDINADEPKCHYFQEDCETICNGNGRWISTDATPSPTTASPTTAPTKDPATCPLNTVRWKCLRQTGCTWAGGWGEDGMCS